MKVAVLALGVLATAVTAQQIPDLPPCGTTCVTSMIGKAEELGCDSGDVACLCSNEDFTYGISDCSREVCQDEEIWQQVVEAGVAFCEAAGVEITTTTEGVTVTTPSDTATVTATGTSTTITSMITVSDDTTTYTTETAIPTIVGGGSSGDDDSDSITEILSTFTSEIVSDGSTFTSEMVATITSSLGDVASDASSIADGVSSTLAGASTSVSSALDNASASVSSALDDASASVSSALNDVTSTSSDDWAPQQTAAPIGVLAAAGIAALLL